MSLAPLNPAKMYNLKVSAEGRPVKSLPQRMCVACHKVGPKNSLLRIVLTPEGVRVDRSGKSRGRGAYLCPARSCWTDGIRKGFLERALKTEFDSAMKESLAADGEQLGLPLVSGQNAKKKTI